MDAVSVGSALGNLVTSTALAVAGVAALSIAVVRSDVRRALPPLLAFLAGAGLCFLAADEGFELHDRIGRWAYYEHGISAPGPVNHVDDLIVIAYVGAAFLGLMFALPTLLAAPRFLGLLLAAGALMAAGTAVDALGTPGSWTDAPEEALETGGALLIAYAFAREAFHLRAPIMETMSTTGELAAPPPRLPQSPGS